MARSMQLRREARLEHLVKAVDAAQAAADATHGALLTFDDEEGDEQARVMFLWNSSVTLLQGVRAERDYWAGRLA